MDTGWNEDRIFGRAFYHHTRPVHRPNRCCLDVPCEPKSLVDATPCYDTIGLYFREIVPSESELKQALNGEFLSPSSKEHRIPVCYELGPDLDSASLRLGISPETLVDIHASTLYSCVAIGFVPGFAYLGDLHEEISGLDRLPTPRTSVAPGSVAITGKQTAVYPSPTPGGWWIIGKTPLTLVDESDDYFPISAGDSVKFYQIDSAAYGELEGERL